MKECKKCGSCCRRLVFKLKVYDKLDLEFYRVRGFKVIGNDVDVVVSHVCPELNEDNSCRLHGVGKPELCRLYPSYVPSDELVEGCGYEDKHFFVEDDVMVQK